jgi:hypothetical protein
MELLYALLAALFGALFAALFTRNIEKGILRQSLSKEAYDQIIVSTESVAQALVNTNASFDKLRTMPIVLRNTQRQAGDAAANPSEAVQELWADYLDELNQSIFAAADAAGSLQTQLQNYGFMYKPLAPVYAELATQYGQVLEVQNQTLDHIRDLDVTTLTTGDTEAVSGVDLDGNSQKASDFRDKLQEFQLTLQQFMFGALFK